MSRGVMGFVLSFAVVVCGICAIPQVRAADPAASCINPRSAWAGNIAPTVYDMAVDAEGNVLLTGKFWGTVDLNPTDSVDERVASTRSYDAFVTKILADGSYAWTYTASGAESALARSVVADADGSVFVAGSFEGTVGFNPPRKGADAGK